MSADNLKPNWNACASIGMNGDAFCCCMYHFYYLHHRKMSNVSIKNLVKYNIE